MAQNVSDQFASNLLEHSIDLARFETHERDKLLKIFEALEAELIHQLRRHDPTAPTLTVYQQQRAAKLLAYVRKIIGEHYRQMHQTLRVDLRELATTEATLTQALGAEIVVDTLFSVGVPEATLKAMVNDLILEGRPLKEWWNRQATGTLDRYGAVVRQGILRGDSINDMVRALQGTRERRYTDGVFQTSRTNIQTLVRTSVQSVANESRMATFRDNADVLKGIEFLTALDAVVCPKCRPYSGQAYTMDGRRLPGTKLAFPGNPPLHPSCRCMWLPVVRPYRDLSKAKGPRFESAVKAIDEAKKAELDGGLGVDLSLPVWLKRQPEVRQRQLLGETRWKLWHAGKLPLTAMINAVTGKPLTLEQLAARRRRAVA